MKEKITHTNIDIVEEFLKTDEWPYEYVGTFLIKTGFEGRNSTFNLFLNTDDGDISCSAILPVRVPDDKRLKIAEFITRINFGLHLGSFKLDFTDGEVIYETVIITDGIVVSMDMVKRMLLTTSIMFDMFHDQLMAQIYSDVTPEEAIKKIDGFYNNK